MANVREQLLQPESGMKRIDDDDSCIIYDNTFLIISNLNCFNGNFHHSKINGAKIIIYVYTQKIYLLNWLGSNRSKNITINIDDKIIDTISLYNPVDLSPIRVSYINDSLSKDYHKITITNNTSDYIDLDCIDIDEDGYLLTEEEYINRTSYHYLIKDNGTNKIYGYDENNNTLLEVSDSNILKDETQYNKCIYDLNNVKDLIDLTSNNITILSNKDTRLIVDGIKSNKELIISNQNLATINAETIHNFLFEVNKVTNGNCKFVISADNGQTWISWNGSSWNTLINTAPLDNNKIKQYSKLSDSEKIQWNKLKDEIWTSGMSTDITDVDYNSILTNKTIRFAFVLYRPTYDDNITLKDTQWLFDRIGSWHKLSEDDIDIAINSNMCTVTPKLQNLQSIKVNILI